MRSQIGQRLQSLLVLDDIPLNRLNCRRHGWSGLGGQDSPRSDNADRLFHGPQGIKEVPFLIKGEDGLAGYHWTECGEQRQW